MTWWKQFQESDMWNPQRQFGEESSKIGKWIGTVMFRRKKVEKMLITSATQKKTKTIGRDDFV